jgi:hypothetical protein
VHPLSLFSSTPTRIACIAALGLCPILAEAQSRHHVTLQLDNDAYNFWLKPSRRPDREYTNGVHLRYEGGSAAGWTRWFGRDEGPCEPGVQRCRERSFGAGQDMFTPPRTRGMPVPPPGSRSNAGWLFVRDGARLLTATSMREFTLTFGVTGPPALAQHTQRIAHSVMSFYDNAQVDWSEQLDFEPGVIASYTIARRYTAGDGGALGADLIPRAVVRAGNVHTDAEVGARLRFGAGMTHPWLPVAGAGDIEVYGSVGAGVRAVARDLFLDGNTGSGKGGVGHEPFVPMLDWGVGARVRWLSVFYGSTRVGRAYAAAPASHTWSSMTAAVTLVR